MKRVVIVGGGVVGLACAARISARYEVLVLEQHARFGTETSSRNSGVMHAGIYYEPGSLKARLCVRGLQMLYERCTKRSIDHHRIGKLIVAQPSEREQLEALVAHAERNGAEVRLLTASQALAMQPGLRAGAALYSPHSGIIDTHGLIADFAAEARAKGAEFAFETRLVDAQPAAAGWRLTVQGPDGEFAFECSALVNAAGLGAHRVAEMVGVDLNLRGIRLWPCKGDYFQVEEHPEVRHLIYPMPEGGGLGIHLTRDLGGALLAGPDATYTDSAAALDVNEAKRTLFADAIQTYFPTIRASQLRPAYAGMRPKLYGPDAPAADFIIDVFDESPRVVQLLGIESPGLTASPAIAEEVESLLHQRC